MKKRILSLMLILCMILVMLPVTVFAAGNIAEVTAKEELTAALADDSIKEIHVTEKGKEVPRILLSRGDVAMGFLPDKVFNRVSKLLDEGWICRAFASAVIIDKISDVTQVEVAVICYQPDVAAAVDSFIDTLVKHMAKGERPVIDLSPKEVEHLVENAGQSTEIKLQKLPKLEKGRAYYKTRRTMTENMAYAAAEGNKGCYVGLFIVVFLVIFSIVSFFFLR